MATTKLGSLCEAWLPAKFSSRNFQVGRPGISSAQSYPSLMCRLFHHTQRVLSESCRDWSARKGSVLESVLSECLDPQLTAV
mmetsp:Transcript_55328/g.132116  ORF Transcript_55328/g.132116 Transcript_55328/m.132116 type:complete len:82 (-) Transcript_55328:671-916(-)